MKPVVADGSKFHNYEAFLAVVEAGNLTRAAKQLGRSLQSISRSLAALEDQLGVVLIRRTTRSASATDAGLSLHQRVSSALREIGQAESELRDKSEQLSGSLRVAGSAFFVARYVVPAIREFSALHPKLEFDLRISEQFTEPVQSGVDLMIRAGNLTPSTLKARKLAVLRRVAFAAPAYLDQHGRPESPSDLTKHRCIVRSSAQDARSWTFQRAGAARARVTVAGTFEADNAYVTNQAALSGIGIATAPFFQVRDAIEAGLAEIVLEEFTLSPLPVHAVWHAEARTPARVERFVDLLVQRLRKEIV